MVEQDPKQITLDVDLPDEQTFGSFVAGSNQVALQHCQSLLAEQGRNDCPFLTFLSGPHATGKSHLLVALSHQATQQNIAHYFLSLDAGLAYPHAILDGLEHTSLVCIDNIHHISHNAGWQQALFDLINRVREVGHTKLVVTANQGPKALDFTLPDLHSRLTWGVSFHLDGLTESACVEALTRKADLRGIRIPQESIKYLVTHIQRDMHSLTDAIASLQQRSLQEKRNISIPFIKQVLGV